MSMIDVLHIETNDLQFRTLLGRGPSSLENYFLTGDRVFGARAAYLSFEFDGEGRTVVSYWKDTESPLGHLFFSAEGHHAAD